MCCGGGRRLVLLLLLVLLRVLPTSSSRRKRHDYLAGSPCPSSLKVFVYEYPGMEKMNWFAYAHRARETCRAGGSCASHFNGEHLLAQFSLEIILHEFFLRSCVRTTNEAEADLFFVPFYGDVAYREDGRPNDPSDYEQAILDIIENQSVDRWERTFNVTGRFWREFPERHILVQPAPVTGLRHPKGRRGWHHYLQQLTAPIWISLELSRSFLAEYPRCSAKNIVVPYPTPGKRWHDGDWRRQARSLNQSAIFAFCHAGDHGCANVRRAIKSEFRKSGGSASIVLPPDNPPPSKSLHHVPRQVLMHLSTFCPCPEGDSPSAKRQYDSVLAGCVPVVVSDDAVWAYTPPFGDLDETKFALRIPEAVALNETMLESLRRIPRESLLELRREGTKARAAYSYYSSPHEHHHHHRAGGNRRQGDPLLDRLFPDGGALDALVKELEKRARQSRWPACRSELELPHYTLSKQYCGPVPYKAEAAKLKTQLDRMSTRMKKHSKHQRRDDQETRKSLGKAIEAFEAGRVYRRH